MSGPVVLNYGAGTNSTALLVGMMERDERPDLVIFSDTGGERPETYEYLDVIGEWLQREMDLPLTVVRWIRKDGTFVSLEDWCHQRGQLPSLAYGMKGCSVKWKAQPIDKFIRKEWEPGVQAVEDGGKIVRLLGYDADEPHRVGRGGAGPGDIWDFRYPLVDWNWGRTECVAAVTRAGLPSPGKSSCFFCPAMKKHEILNLRRARPDLIKRAIAIEHAAESYSTVSKGLGRNWTWEDLVKADEAQVDMFRDRIDLPCGCYDG